uniref:Uncharacterized protein n=1 Tax=Amphilophus citrinellus TaxID=61819 RepID=A0A3Q0RUJ1_AMPCI
MKLQWLLPGTIMMSVALVGIMKMRKSEQDKYDKGQKFQEIRVRVANDVLAEYQNEKAQKEKLMKNTITDHKLMEEAVNTLQTNAEKAKEDVDVCQTVTVRRKIQPATKKSQAEAPKQEEAKAEAPKQEEAKAEAPKQEEAKAEAPKQEEAKAEAPKS